MTAAFGNGPARRRRSRPRPKASKQQTLLARRRLERGMTQAQLAKLTGISRATIQRLERGEVEQPSVRVLANCAHVLGVQLEDVIEPAWREWYVFDATDAPRPPMERFLKHRSAGSAG